MDCHRNLAGKVHWLITRTTVFFYVPVMSPPRLKIDSFRYRKPSNEPLIIYAKY